MIYSAAKTMHHHTPASLIGHLLETTRIAKLLTTIVPCHDELVLLCAACHDIAKPVEYEINSLGFVTDYTRKSRLVGGHIVLGTLYIEALCKELNISGETKELIQHCMLSHHGKPEYGSPTPPKTIEAFIVHTADEISSKLFEYREALSKLQPGEFSPPIWGLENTEVYKIIGDYMSDTMKIRLKNLDDSKGIQMID